MLKISHTILHLCCTEGVSTERSLELFRAYNYTPRIEQQLLCSFLLAPVIFLTRQS
uniref:Uncharacterized protein n=2 Tax=Enterobacteriaceae TaxID=543 RepID=A0A1L2E0I0_ECOLX|nr:putative incF replication protein RepA3 [Klebsiella pneumoniae]ANI75765.1 hypothetical protein SA002 [Escherichia coli]AUG88611.1 hypothetical protein [Klebsiella pneumoniae]AWF76538.1 hypothetical protein [Escherichia coli]AWM63864.1 Hypothetical protein [Klebsiella pneumoniae]